jgi:hypothetical protein
LFCLFATQMSKKKGICSLFGTASSFISKKTQKDIFLIILFYFF